MIRIGWINVNRPLEILPATLFDIGATELVPEKNSRSKELVSDVESDPLSPKKLKKWIK